MSNAQEVLAELEDMRAKYELENEMARSIAAFLPGFKKILSELSNEDLVKETEKYNEPVYFSTALKVAQPFARAFVRRELLIRLAR